jgi:Leucine-rich repeat (LRR) protein
MPIEIAAGSLGRRVILRDPLSDADVEHIRRSGISRVWVLGFGERALPNLAALEGVVDELDVLTLNITSDAAVTSLPSLRSLSLESYARNRIDFRTFTNLERLHLNWRRGAETALENENLRNLSISRYPFTDLGPLAKLNRLEGLRIANSRGLASLAGIGNLPNLKRLWLIDNRALSDLGHLAADRPSLVDLSMNTCRSIRDVGGLRAQVDLQSVTLINGGRVASLRPLASLPRLQTLWFYESTVIENGDLSVLLEMPALQRTSFANRRRYSHKSEFIERELERRGRGPATVSEVPHWWW